MPMLTNDRLIQAFETNVVVAPVAANTIIYAGALVALNTSNGTAVPASDAANRVVLGVAEERADNSTGAAGAKSVKVRFGRAYKFNASGTINNTHIGRVAYVVDDNTVSVSLSINRVKAGKIVAVDPDGVWVWIPYPGLSVGAPSSTIDATYDTNESGVLSALRDQHNNYEL